MSIAKTICLLQKQYVYFKNNISIDKNNMSIVKTICLF